MNEFQEKLSALLAQARAKREKARNRFASCLEACQEAYKQYDITRREDCEKNREEAYVKLMECYGVEQGLLMAYDITLN